MFGIADVGIYSAYLLSVISGVACVIYGVYNWNKGCEEETSQIKEEVSWEEEEVGKV